MKNKAKVEKVIFAIGVHMSQCVTCIHYLILNPEGSGDPPCTEYRRMKAEAKALAQ